MSRGVRVVHADQLSSATPQTSGMRRLAGVSPQTTGAQNLWMGLVATPAGMMSGWHHHGDCETGIFVMKGRARFSWGKDGTESAEVAQGDFLSVAPGAVHKEEALGDEEVVFVVARACSAITVVNVAGPESE